MEKVHKGNLWVIVCCVVALSLTTVLSYGFSAKTARCVIVLIITLLITLIACFLKISDFAKALIIVIVPSYALLAYSALCNGNAVAFMASFVTLGMAVRYFDKNIVKYYAIAFIIPVILSMIFYPAIIDKNMIGGTSKIVLWIATAALLYLGTEYGQKKSTQAEEALKEVKNNAYVATQIALKLNNEIVACTEQVKEVTSHAATVKSSAEQMEQVVEESSRALQTVSEKFNTSKEYINKNYEYAKKLEESFGVVTDAVGEGDKVAKNVKTSMIDMSHSVSSASDATSGLLAQMEEISGILNDINAIAGQTNLLSLNASIEAARAGETWKRFCSCC